MEDLKKRIQHLKKKRPGYKEILDFFLKVRKAQGKIKPSLKLETLQLKKEWKALLSKEGFPLLEKKDFPIDQDSSLSLFHSLCEIAKGANPTLAKKVGKIEKAILQKGLDLKKVLTGELSVEKAADQFGLDKKVFLFLTHNSITPSIEAIVEQIQREVDPETWLKGYCPLCGSLPYLALLKGEGGKRYLLCSYCGYEWRVDRLFCPFCGNKDQGTLQYFTAEGEEHYRVDICDQCRQYIKTIDLREMELMDPGLEDLATLHLDLIASKKEYKRPVPNPWTP
ncbi:MAG: formate dehydrogenase accessory protein FdhE [Thermodesulfobacteriota bacterium]